MKKIFILALSLVLIGFAGAASAKHHKSTILHCGCVYDADADEASMVYQELSVSHKTRGHDEHVVGSIDSCFTGQELVDDVLVDTFSDFVRTGDDCQLDGPPLGDPIDSCFEDDVQQVFADDICGEEALLQ